MYKRTVESATSVTGLVLFLLRFRFFGTVWGYTISWDSVGYTITWDSVGYTISWDSVGYTIFWGSVGYTTFWDSVGYTISFLQLVILYFLTGQGEYSIANGL